jgi:hypothetical protein
MPLGSWKETRMSCNLNGAHQLHVYAADVELGKENMNTMKRKTLLNTTK